MAQSKSTRTAEPKKRTTKRKPKTPATEPHNADFGTAFKASKANIHKHSSAENTNTAYAGYIKRGREWIARFIPSDKPTSPSQPEPVNNSNDCPSYVDDVNPTMDPDFPKAFDESGPNRWTPLAIAMHMSFKCFDENKGKSTGESIRAAFKQYYTAL